MSSTELYIMSSTELYSLYHEYTCGWLVDVSQVETYNAALVHVPVAVFLSVAESAPK